MQQEELLHRVQMFLCVPLSPVKLVAALAVIAASAEPDPWPFA